MDDSEEGHRGWLIAIGVVLAVLGLVAMGAAVATTVVSVVLLGMLLVIGGAVSLTLILAIFLLVGGLFRILAAPLMQAANLGWVLASGIVSVLLGATVLAGWPVSGLWAIGLFVGIEMFVYGMSQVMLGIGHRAPERVHAHREAA